MNVTILGLSVALIVVAVVELLKLLWPATFSGNRPIIAAVIVAEVLVLGEHAAGIYPVFAEWWYQVITGLLVALSSMGLFDMGKATVGAAKKAWTGPPVD